MSKAAEQIGWVIVGIHGMYTGWQQTKREMIEVHENDTGCAWDYCQRKGDRCVKVKITEVKRAK